MIVFHCVHAATSLSLVDVPACCTACDFDWLFLSGKHHGVSLLPACMYTFDTYHVVSHYKACKFNKDKYKGEVPKDGLYKLKNLYRAVTGEPLDNAHDAFADCVATGKVAMDPAVWYVAV